MLKETIMNVLSLKTKEEVIETIVVNPTEIMIDSKVIELKNKFFDFKFLNTALLGIAGILTVKVCKVIDILVKNKVIEPMVIGIKDVMSYLNSPILPFVNVTCGQIVGLSVAVILTTYIYRVKVENEKRAKKGEPLIPDVYKTHPTMMLVISIIMFVILGIVML